MGATRSTSANDGVIASSNVLFVTVDLSNVSVNEVHTGVVVVVEIPRTDPSAVTLQIVVDLSHIGRGDINETDTMGSAEHDGLVVGERFRAQNETRN